MRGHYLLPAETKASEITEYVKKQEMCFVQHTLT